MSDITGFILGLSFLIIMYWVKVSSTIKQIIDLKSSNHTTM